MFKGNFLNKGESSEPRRRKFNYWDANGRAPLQWPRETVEDTRESPHNQCTLYWWLPLSPTYRTVLQADKMYNEAGLPASPFQVRAYLSEAALLADGLGQGSRMTIICVFKITGAQRLYSVQDKVSWGRSPLSRDQAREIWTVIGPCLPTPPKEKQNIALLRLPLSNVSGLGSLTCMADKNTVTNLKYLLNLSLCP